MCLLKDLSPYVSRRTKRAAFAEYVCLIVSNKSDTDSVVGSLGLTPSYLSHMLAKKASQHRNVHHKDAKRILSEMPSWLKYNPGSFQKRDLNLILHGIGNAVLD